MVYAVGIEVFRHLLEASAPPAVSVMGHTLPVVCRESPVLPHNREIIRRCSCLAVEVEQVGILPCVSTVGGYAYRNVAFQGHSAAMGIITCATQLSVKMILHEEDEIHLFGRVVHQIGDKIR